MPAQDGNLAIREVILVLQQEGNLVFKGLYHSLYMYILKGVFVTLYYFQEFFNEKVNFVY